MNTEFRVTKPTCLSQHVTYTLCQLSLVTSLLRMVSSPINWVVEQAGLAGPLQCEHLWFYGLNRVFPGTGWGFLGKLAWPTSCHHRGVFYSGGYKSEQCWGQKTKCLENSTSNCIPGGNSLESQFSWVSWRKIKKPENNSWEIYLVSHGILQTKA